MFVPDSPEFDETKGFGLVGMAMATGILSRLEIKGLLHPREVDEVLEGVLSTLEGFGRPDDPGVRAARVIAEGIAQVAVLRRRSGPIQPE
jgi:hypothetical protein